MIFDLQCHYVNISCKRKTCDKFVVFKKSVTLHLGCTKQLFILIKKELIHNNKTI